MTLPRRHLPRKNYALANLRGFSSSRSVRSKKVTNRKVVSAPPSSHSSPSSPEKQSKLGKNTSSRVVAKNGKNKIVKNKNVAQTDLRKVAERLINVTGTNNFVIIDEEENANQTSPVHILTPDNIDVANSLIAEINTTGPRMTTLEEKKRRAVAEIQEMEAQLKAMDDDEELRKLLQRQSELKEMLEKRKSGQASTSGSSPKAKHASKRGSVRQLMGLGSENFLEQVKITGEDIESKMPSLDEIQDALHITEKRPKTNKRVRRVKKKSSRRRRTSSESSESETSNSETSSDSESSDDEDRSFKRKKGRKIKSGLFARAANEKLVSNEWYAHAALDSEVGDKDPKSLSFNLLVAGELEIISDSSISKKERDTRIEVLKSLAYKHEYLSRPAILEAYTGFLKRIEKGKFRWGSKRDLREFEQKLLYALTVEGRRGVKLEKGKDKLNRLEDRTKYCLDYNRGTCKLERQHEGKLGGQVVLKHHICRRCLVEDQVELYHAEKDCIKSK